MGVWSISCFSAAVYFAAAEGLSERERNPRARCSALTASSLSVFERSERAPVKLHPAHISLNKDDMEDFAERFQTFVLAESGSINILNQLTRYFCDCMNCILHKTKRCCSNNVFLEVEHYMLLY